MLKEFATVALDVERDKDVEQMCECCNSRYSCFLYLIKAQVYGIFHICKQCKEAVEQLPSSLTSIAFVPKNVSSYE
jgi:hypothetical protein